MQNAMSKESITSSAKKSSKRERTCYCTSFEIELLSLTVMLSCRQWHTSE